MGEGLWIARKCKYNIASAGIFDIRKEVYNMLK